MLTKGKTSKVFSAPLPEPLGGLWNGGAGCKLSRREISEGVNPTMRHKARKGVLGD